MICSRIIGYNGEGKPIFKPKIKFKTLDEAIHAAKVMNSYDKIILKLVAYKCQECGFYHIGRNGKELKQKDKNKYKKQIKNSK